MKMQQEQGLSADVKAKLIALASALVDQEQAEIKIQPMERQSGFWFGGGDMIREPNGNFAIVGRFRNSGDSRTGLEAGQRGLECAIFRAPAFDGAFAKVKRWSKADLNCGGKRVTSIEGTAFRQSREGIELFISSEKDVPYPAEVGKFQKPGTGVWNIDMIKADSIDDLDSGDIREVLASDNPVSLHVKDPFIVDQGTGDTQLMLCLHPFSWSCSYTGLAVRKEGSEDFEMVDDYLLTRGHVWDVAAARVTDRMRVPQVGVLKDLPPLSLYFYDGAECVRKHEQNPNAVKRPRGYSCEEIGGLAWGWDDAFPAMSSLSVMAPFFVSPYGTGCSRYVATLVTDDAVYATWQQSQENLSQPLVGHHLSMEQVEKLLR